MKNYLIVLFYLILFTGCDNKIYASEENTTLKTTIKHFNLAKVNNHLITSNILTKKKIKNFPKWHEEEKKRVVESMVNHEIILQYVFGKKNEKDILNERKRMSRGFALIREIAIESASSTFTDENLMEIYEKNKKSYWHEKVYNTSHILLKDENQTKDFIVKLHKSNDLNRTFHTLAKEFSQDKSSVKGGYLGHFESKVMVEPFKKALESLAEGEFSKYPVKTKFGYHIIWLHNIVEKGYITFPNAKPEIVRNLKIEVIDKWYFSKLNELKEKSTIVYLYDLNST
ncbi:MAG: peptidylprolyl isomerase, partial [Sulfurovum sp.]|nr:peptidylprolyl isomerase [Sulfurovum sp.]